jgi:uncharacterized membrane protein HdeD (DUF308 family)
MMNTFVFRHWWAMALRGVVAILFGLIALFWTRMTLEFLVIGFGAFALLSGILAVVVALGDRGAHERWGVLLAEGLAGIGIGAITFFWPAITALALLFVIVVWALVNGILEIAVAVWMHRAVGNEWLLLLGGIASVLFGILLALLPAAGLLALTWLIGLFAIVFGVLLLVLAFQWHGLSRKLVTL